MTQNTLMSRADFDKGREKWRKGITSSKELAVILSNASIGHFAACGDTSLIQDFYDDVATHGKNYVRKAALLKWLVAFVPVKMVERKFVKDKESAAQMNWDQKDENGNYVVREAQLAKAAAKAFFDFDPEATITNFAAGDVVDLLEKTIKRLKNTKTHKAADPAAVAMVERAEKLVSTLRVPEQQAAA